MSPEHTSARRPDPVWVPVVAPIVWSAHFMTLYAWAALACGRFTGARSNLDAAIVVLTVVASAVIAAFLVRASKQLRHQLPRQPYDDPTPEDRSRFMAFTTLLLAAMSLIGTLFVGAAAWAIGGCQ